MAKIVNISEIHPTLGFTEFDILEKYLKVLMRVSLASFIQSFRLNVAKAPGLSDRRTGPGTDSVLPQDRPYGPEGIHRILRQATGGTSEQEHTLPDFLWNYDSPSLPRNQLQDSQCHP